MFFHIQICWIECQMLKWLTKISHKCALLCKRQTKNYGSTHHEKAPRITALQSEWLNIYWRERLHFSESNLPGKTSGEIWKRRWDAFMYNNPLFTCDEACLGQSADLQGEEVLKKNQENNTSPERENCTSSSDRCPSPAAPSETILTTSKAEKREKCATLLKEISEVTCHRMGHF